MTPIDDLKVGMFVAVTYVETPEPSPFAMFGPQAPSYNGVPLEVLSISLPFICVSDGKHRFAIDVREVSVQKLSTDYVRQMRGDVPGVVIGRKKVVQSHRVKRKKKPKPDAKTCPRCGAKRVERLVRPGEWALYCNVCGYDGLDKEGA